MKSLVVWIILTALPSVHAADRACVDASLGRSAVQAFWAQTKPVLVNVRGENYPVTWSNDSEVGDDNLFKLGAKVPLLTPLLKNAFPGTVTLATIAFKMSMSEKQARAFVVRKGVPLTQTEFHVSELNPTYIPYVLELKGGREILVSLFGDYVKSLGLPYKTILDNSVVEFQYDGYATIPAEFRTTIGKFNSTFAHPSTHFHAGLPSAMGPEKTTAIARAIETLAVLARAERWPSLKRPLSQFRGTTLVNVLPRDEQGFLSTERGVIRYDEIEWMHPHPTANIELRIYDDYNHAYALLKMLAELGQNQERLILPDVHSLRVYPDNYVGNITGALGYAALILSASSDPQMQNLAIELDALAISIYHTTVAAGLTPDPKMKVRVAEFLKANDLRGKLTREAFLKSQP